jgi:hypothetical protein
MAHTPPVPSQPATEPTPMLLSSPGLVRHATVLIFIPADHIGEGGGVIRLMEQILTRLGRIQFTLPASFGVYSYRARLDLTHSFRH